MLYISPGRQQKQEQCGGGGGRGGILFSKSEHWRAFICERPLHRHRAKQKQENLGVLTHNTFSSTCVFKYRPPPPPPHLLQTVFNYKTCLVTKLYFVNKNWSLSCELNPSLGSFQSLNSSVTGSLKQITWCVAVFHPICAPLTLLISLKGIHSHLNSVDHWLKAFSFFHEAG